MHNGMEDIETMHGTMMRGALHGARPAGRWGCGAASRGRLLLSLYPEFGCSDVEFCQALLLEEQVAIIPGSAF